jgi:hypothetical protein
MKLLGFIIFFLENLLEMKYLKWFHKFSNFKHVSSYFGRIHI